VSVFKPNDQANSALACIAVLIGAFVFAAFTL
jgi:hypothetical protein